MGAYSVPEEVRKMKPKGTIVKVVKGKYYVYTHSQVKDPETGKWKTKPGKIIGHIVPGVGYNPNDSAAKNSGITCFDYGQYILICSLCQDDYTRLKQCLNPDEAMMIFALATIFTTETYIGLKAAESQYEHSLFARDYPDLPFSYRRIAKLLEYLGRQSTAKQFQVLCVKDAGDEISLDGHCIPTDSENNGLCSANYKTRAAKTGFMNLLTALDVATGMPVASMVFPGYILDKKAFKNFVAGLGSIEGKIFLIDMGVSSKENMDYIHTHGGFFVTPLPETREEHSVAMQSKPGRMKSFLYNCGSRSDLVEYRTVSEGDGRRIIYYRNSSEANRLTMAYLDAIDKGKKGYTQEKLDKAKKSFGVVILESNHSGKPEELFAMYKRRWSIETYYDRLKNGCHFEELNLDDWAVVQGLAFVMMIAGRMDARLLAAAKKVSFSRKELLQLMDFLKLEQRNDKGEILNTKKRHFNVCSTLGIALDPSKRCLG